MGLVLLPGMDGSGVLFRPLVAALPSGLRPVVVAYPPDEPLGYAELLPRVMSSLPTSPFLLLGESFSGPLALMAAAARPPALRGVILCATFVRNPLWLRTKLLAPLVRPLPFRLFAAFTMGKALLGGYSTPELRSLSKEALAGVTPEVLAHRARSLIEVDVRADLRDCPVPILYIRGTRDLVVPGHNLKEIVAARPSVNVVRLAGPHLILQTRAREAAAAIASFAAATALPPSDPPPAPRLAPPSDVAFPPAEC